ncbi:hypothetical protein [Actinoalloteichus caeruleus]|uniref:hypothetical protein n=2 Tax=Actinoalloteichus cyanogriseus TaxID=2893586 RepID=UPI0004109FF4|nr:hypothetical protein [Actinoalloteichus caeruleus]
MDAVQVLRVLARRWRLTLALGALLGGVLAAVAVAVPPQQRVTAVLLAITEPGPEGGNPFARVDRAQEQAATLVRTVLTAPGADERLAAAGVVGDVEVSNDDVQLGGASAFLTVTVTAETGPRANASVARVIDLAGAELRERQERAGVTAGELVVLSEVVAPGNAVTTRGAQLRALGLLGALGAAALTAVVLLVDRRKPGPGERGAGDPPEPTPRRGGGERTAASAPGDGAVADRVGATPERVAGG